MVRRGGKKSGPVLLSGRTEGVEVPAVNAVRDRLSSALRGA